MSHTFRDEQTLVPRRIGAIQQRVGLAVLALLITGPMNVSSPAARAEEEGAKSPPIGATPFTATITDMQSDTERIVIPRNRSVLIEMSHPVTAVQAVSAEIVIVQSIKPTQFMISGATYGETQVIAWSADGSQHVFEVAVELDLEALSAALLKIDPRSEVRITPIHGNIILTGSVSSATAAERMLHVAELFMTHGDGRGGGIVQNHLEVMGEQQVLLRCTVAEVNRRATRELGINGFLAGDAFRDAFVINQLGGINPIDIGAAGNVNVLQDIPFLTGSAGIPLSPASTLSLGFPRVQMQVFLRAMAENSLMRVLAEPNLVAISGETATFLAGGEFPYPVPQEQNITIEFREFGVRLNFTPVVLPNQTIRLRVEPEISALDFSSAVQIGGTVVPGLTQRKTHTVVEIGNGQTIAIAGLLNEEIRGVVSRIPGIGDVPILGALFRSVEYHRNLTEMVILVTPEIIAPLNPDQVPAVPGQHLSSPNDWQLYTLGLIEGDPFEGNSAAMFPVSQQTEPEKLSLHGPWGESTYKDFR